MVDHSHDRAKVSLTVIVAIAFIVGGISGGMATFILEHTKTENDYIKDYFTAETAVHVSPHGLRKHMGEDDTYVLVDLRSEEEYLEEHIIGAVNIPAYKDRDHSDYGAVNRIVSSFKELREKNPQKDIIVYCYSVPCMTGRKVGKILVDHGIYVKHLAVGWNEWRYHWTLWNHPHEWNQTKVEDYLWSGPEPGKIERNSTSSGCPAQGSLGC